MTGRTLVLISSANGGVRDYARQSIPEWRRRGWRIRHLEIPDTGAPAVGALRASRRERALLRDAGAVHVELGSNDAGAFWLACLICARRRDVTVTAHDPQKLSLHPGAALLPGRGALGRRIGHRVLAPVLDGPARRFLRARAGGWVVLGAGAAAAWRSSVNGPVLAAPFGAGPATPASAPSSGRHILFAGYLGPRKGIDVLLRAWAAVGAQAGLPLVIAGEPGAGAEAWAGGLRAEGERQDRPPRWTGWVSEGELDELFAAAAVVVLPYTEWSPGSAILARAMTTGRAIVATRGAATDELLEDRRDARLVAPGDARALAEALLALASDPEERDRLGAAAAARAEEALGWADYVGAVSELQEIHR